MINMKYFQSIGFCGLTLFIGLVSCFLITPMYANAGASGYESVDIRDTGQTSQVTVTLRGADRQGVVQIVDYLLGSFPGVVEKKEGELHVVPVSKNECIARWQLTVSGLNGMDIESKLISTINSLDLQANNDIFYESPFIIIAQDLKIVKQIKSRKASKKDVMLSLLSEDFGPFVANHPKEYLHAENPWRLVPGAGFE